MFMDLFKKKTPTEAEHRTNRRGFLALSMMTLSSIIIPKKTIATIKDFFVPERSLSFYNIHTDERLEAVYWRDGEYLEDALSQINYFLRDYRTGEVKPIDINLLDLLCVLNEKIKNSNPFHVISGYRSKKTNAILRKRSRKVAKNSLHIFGKAIDIRLPDCELGDLRLAAMELRGGGVGYYPYRGYIHVDVGEIRYW